MKIPRGVWIAAVAGLAVAAISGMWVDSKFREWDQRATQAEAVAGAERARADSAAIAASVESRRADSTAAYAEALAATTRERVRIVRDTVAVPEPCEEIVAQRDELIDSLIVEADSWRDAYHAERRAVDALRIANTALTVAYDSLTAVLEDRPRPRPRWAPSLQAGVFAGICSDGKPCVGVGAGLTVEVKLPTPRLPWDG